MVTFAEADKALMWCDSYSRMESLLELRARMNQAEWLQAVGEHWTCCDNIGAYRLRLRRLLPETGPVPQLMTPEEAAAYEALPSLLTAYRGCGPANMLGASWSLDRETAARFPTLHRYRQAEPLLVTARVRKHHVLAVKLGREEAEIITFRARRIEVERLVLEP